MAEIFGDLLRRLRDNAGRSQREQVDELNRLQSAPTFTRTEWSRYERNARVPRPRTVRLIAQSFAVPEGELLRAAATARAERDSRKTMTPSTVDDDDLLSMVADGVEEPVRRRQFMGAATLGIGLASEPWGRLAYAIGYSPAINAEVAATMAERTAAVFAAEETLPARQLYGSLTAHLDQLTALLGSGGEHRLDLLVAAGETAALAGWLTYDMGDLSSARHYYQVATRAGQEADHPPLTALVLAYTSYAVDDPRAARDLLRTAHQRVRGPGYATARAWISAREAEESARLSDHEGALRAAERAHAVYDYAQPGQEQHWVRFFSKSRLDSMIVAAYARLNHPDLTDVSEAALASLEPDDAKVKAIILGDVATAYVMRGDVERGCTVARQALDVTQRFEVTLGRQRLATLAKQLPTDHKAARQLAQELRAGLV